MAKIRNSLTALLIVSTAILRPTEIQAQQIIRDSLSQLAPQSFDQPINPDLYLIRPGERLVVTPIKAGIAASELVVGPEGKIVDARMGVIDVNGLTLTDTRKKLAEPLAGQFRSAQIDVSVSGPRLVSITVTGAVVHPGTYQLWTSQSVVDAISRAGGLLLSASTRRIEFSGGPHSLSVDLDRIHFARDAGANLPLYAGMHLHIPLRSSATVRVIGEVVHPRDIEFVEGDTRDLVIALAGGVLPTGDTAGAEIRTDPLRKKSNPLMRAEDILIVPILRQTLELRGVVVAGAVWIRSAYSSGMTLPQVFDQASAVISQIALDRAVIFRRSDRMQPGSDTVPTTPIGNLVDESGKLRALKLEPLDSIYVPFPVGVVKVTGQVRRPGTFPFTKGHTVSNYVGGAGGFTAASSQISVSIRNRVTGQIFLAAPESIVEDGDEVLISLTDGQP